VSRRSGHRCQRRSWLPSDAVSPRLAVRILTCVLVLCLAPLRPGRAGGSPQGTKPAGAAAIKARTVDACTLLTKADFQNATGEPVAEARPSAQPAGRIKTSQCLFRAPTFAKSVSLTVATAGDGYSASALRQFWRNQFHSARGKEEEELTAGERGNPQSSSEARMENAARKPRSIAGLGDEAFWVGSPISGALYVLQGDLFLRLSVGGIPEESSRLAKSKIAASAAIARLRPAFRSAASNLRK
jgi:hypothetical protein